MWIIHFYIHSKIRVDMGVGVLLIIVTIIILDSHVDNDYKCSSESCLCRMINFSHSYDLDNCAINEPSLLELEM